MRSRADYSAAVDDIRALIRIAEPATAGGLDDAARVRLIHLRRAITAQPRAAGRRRMSLPSLPWRRHRDRWHPSRLLVTGLTAAVAAGIAVVSFAGGTAAPAGGAGTGIRLTADYHFRLPAGFVLGRKALPCAAFVGVVAVPIWHRKNGIQPVDVSIQRPAYALLMNTASSAAGGCINVVLGPSYLPTGRIPDPQVSPAWQQVRVGQFRGALESYLLQPGKGGTENIREWVTQLNVQLPVGHGRFRDLAVGSARLPDSVLIQITAQGLASR